MSWMDLHDGLLDHPKFIRAQKRGGSEAIHLWLGLRQYVAQQLSDGFIPTDMLDEVRGPEGRRRATALQVLKDVGLVDEAPGGVMLHDFLHWSKSRDKILAAREANRLRQEKSRANPSRLSRVTDAVTHADVTPLVTLPSPLLSTPLHSEESSARAPEAQLAPDSEPEPKLTSCPLNLAERPETAIIVRDFVEKYSLSAEQIRDVVREFVSYWTIGGGMGRKHANWPKKLREHIRRRCEEPGAIQAPGALEHASRQPRRQRQSGGVTALAEVISAPYHETYKLPDYLKD